MTNLYEEIDRLVEDRLKRATATGEEVDPTVWVAELAENLADMIVFGAPDELRPKMLRYAITCRETFVEQNEQILEEERRRSRLQ